MGQKFVNNFERMTAPPPDSAEYEAMMQSMPRWTVLSSGPDCGTITHHYCPQFMAYWSEESTVLQGIDLHALTYPLHGTDVVIPGFIPGVNGAKSVHLFAHSWRDFPTFTLFEPRCMDGLMQQAADAVRARTRPPTPQKFSILELKLWMGLVIHHEFPRGAIWWRVADFGYEIPASPTPRIAVLVKDSLKCEIELAEGYWEDPKPGLTEFFRLAQRAAVLIDAWK